MGGQFALCFVQAFHQRAQLLEELVFAFRHRTGYDKRSTCIVNQHRVDLIDDCIVVLTLYQVFRAVGHVVTEVVEAEFIVRTERDVGHVGFATCVGVGLMLVDAVHAQSVEFIKRSHPFGVTLGQVVVHRHHVYTVSCQGVQEYGQCGHEGFTFTCCHLGNLSFVQDDAAKQLYVIVHHVPCDFRAAGHPVVLVDSFVAFDADEVFCRCKFTVEVGCCYFDFCVFREAACRVLYDGEGLWQNLVQRFFIAVEHFLFQFVDLGEESFAFFQLCLFDLGFQFFDFSTLFSG